MDNELAPSGFDPSRTNAVLYDHAKRGIVEMSENLRAQIIERATEILGAAQQPRLAVYLSGPTSRLHELAARLSAYRSIQDGWFRDSDEHPTGEDPKRLGAEPASAVGDSQDATTLPGVILMIQEAEKRASEMLTAIATKQGWWEVDLNAHYWRIAVQAMLAFRAEALEEAAKVADAEAAGFRADLEVLTSETSRACAANRMGSAENVAKRIRALAASSQEAG